MTTYKSTPTYGGGPLFGGRRRNHRKAIIVSTLKSMLWADKRRKVATIISTLMLAAATAAIAYYVLNATGSGSQTQTLGTAGTQAVQIDVTGVPANMKPGDQTEFAGVAANLTNSSDNPVRVNSFDKEVLVDGQPAPAGYFTLTTDTTNLPPRVFAPHTTQNLFDGTLTFNNLPDQDQSDVAGKQLTVRITVH